MSLVPMDSAPMRSCPATLGSTPIAPDGWVAACSPARACPRSVTPSGPGTVAAYVARVSGLNPAAANPPGAFCALAKSWKIPVMKSLRSTPAPFRAACFSAVPWSPIMSGLCRPCASR